MANPFDSEDGPMIEEDEELDGLFEDFELDDDEDNDDEDSNGDSSDSDNPDDGDKPEPDTDSPESGDDPDDGGDDSDDDDGSDGDEGSESESEIEKRARELLQAEEDLRREQEENQRRNKPTKITAEEIAIYDELMSDSDLPEGKVSIGGKEVDIRHFVKEYPEAAAVTKVVAADMAKRMYGSKIEDLVRTVNNQQFWLDVYAVHPDGRQIAKSSQFSDWLNDQSQGVQKLATNGNSDDANIVLSAYKKQTTKAKPKAKPKKEKNPETGLLSGSLKGGTDRSTANREKKRSKKKAAPTEEDLDKLFDEYEID